MKHPTDITGLPATALTLHLGEAADDWMRRHPGTTWLEVLQSLEQIRFEITETLISQREADRRAGLSPAESQKRRSQHGNDR